MAKRVLILANHFMTLYAFRLELIERLLSEGYEVILSLPPSEENAFYEKLGCRVCPTELERHSKNPFKDMALLHRYKRLVRDTAPDVVLTYTIKPNIYGGMACAGLNVPYVANITGLGTAVVNGGAMQKLTLVLYRVGLRKARKVFFQNAANVEFMRSRRAVTVAYDVLPGSGVNLQKQAFEPYPADSGGMVFLTIGRVMRDKGINELLAAARAVKKDYPETVFRIIGFYDDDCRSQVESAAKEGVIEYLGQRKDVHELICASNATIHPSYHEGMSNVLLETAASGRPVIASDIPGCRESFDEGVSGLGFRPRDAEDLARAIREFIELPYDKKCAMGLAGRKKMEREFDRQMVVDAYMKEIYEIEDRCCGSL